MRLWVHRIWLKRNPETVLMTCGPREDKRLEEFIRHMPEECVAAYAWYLYVNSDPPAYNLAPIKHVNAWTSPKGHRFVDEHEDTAAITRFPLSAFLAVVQGYEVKALLDYEKLTAYIDRRKQMTPEAKKKEDGGLSYRGPAPKPSEWSDWVGVMDLMKAQSKQVGQRWGKAIEKEPEF